MPTEPRAEEHQAHRAVREELDVCVLNNTASGHEIFGHRTDRRPSEKARDIAAD